MDFEPIIQLISNLAFPIAMCVWLMMMINDMTKQHKEEMQKVVDALNNNTRTIEMLHQKIDFLKDDGK